jgi:predicted nucleic acid-binding protein
MRIRVRQSNFFEGMIQPEADFRRHRLGSAIDTAPVTMPVIDGLIAATALVHGLTVVTRNVSDIIRTGVPYMNPLTV